MVGGKGKGCQGFERWGTVVIANGSCSFDLDFGDRLLILP